MFTIVPPSGTRKSKVRHQGGPRLLGRIIYPVMRESGIASVAYNKSIGAVAEAGSLHRTLIGLIATDCGAGP